MWVSRNKYENLVSTEKIYRNNYESLMNQKNSWCESKDRTIAELKETLALLLEFEPELKKYRKTVTLYPDTYMEYDETLWDIPGMRTAKQFKHNQKTAEKYSEPVVRGKK